MGYFKEWLSKVGSNQQSLLPITHISKGFSARKIIDSGLIAPVECPVFKEDLVYAFYGRVAYRVAGGGPLKLEGVCPFCFVFDGELVKRSKHVHPFDTGAYAKRLYKHVFDDQLEISDFEISGDPQLPNALVHRIFGGAENYLVGNLSEVPSADDLCAPSEMEVRAYHELISSLGRNEPDDRVYSIEITFSDALLLSEHLKAVIVPHTFWTTEHPAEWLTGLHNDGVEIATYEFHPGRSADYYHAHLESQLRDLFRNWGFFSE
jgi:hypothetical protein